MKGILFQGGTVAILRVDLVVASGLVLVDFNGDSGLVLLAAGVCWGVGWVASWRIRARR